MTVMSPYYSQLIDSTERLVAEDKHGHTYTCLTERHIQVLWFEQKYVRAWQTGCGKKIEILSPGLWNTEAGPDFLKAHLRINGQDYKGDVEIHLQDESWYLHRHQEDERYDQVVLHLSFYLPKKPSLILKKNGKVPLQAYLEEEITISPSRLIKLIDLDLYPYKRFAGAGKCASQLFKSLPEESLKIFLTSAAFWRLEKKEAFLRSRLADRSLQLIGGIAMALGYKHNAEAFLELFIYLLPYRDLPYSQLFALSLGCCGFFEQGRRLLWEDSIYYQQLRALWWEIKEQATHQAYLRLDHIRPLNHPVRRLAYLIKLLQDSKMDSLWQEMMYIWNQGADSLNCKEMLDQLIQLIPDYTDAYWNWHFTFEAQRQRRELPWIGQDLKKEILVNTFLPLLYVTIRGEGKMAHLHAFHLFYQSLKASQANKSRYLTQRFFGENEKGKLLNQAVFLQGAYQIHKDFCVHFEASCEGCPFVDRYLAESDSIGCGASLSEAECHSFH